MVQTKYTSAPTILNASAYSSTSLFIIASLNGGRSLGEREVIRLPSTTSSSSAHVAPVFRKFVCNVVLLVILRPFSTPASASIHAAWQIEATGLSASKQALVNSPAALFIRS